MKLQVLVAAVNQNVDALPEKMGLETDAILVNQCGHAAYQEYEHKGKQIRCFSMKERGVGLNRNTALLHADTALLGEEVYRESTWFEGYHDKFFFDRGVLYHDLYGWLAGLFSLRFLWSHRAQMLTEKSFLEAFGLMKKGISEGKKRR